MTRRDVLIVGGGISLAGSLSMLTAGSALADRTKNVSSSYPVNSSIELDAEWQEVAEIFETRGIIKPGNVLLIELSRSDIHAAIFHVPIKPDLALDTEITFQHINDSKTIVKYELVLRDQEVNPVQDILFSQNLQPATTTLNALHNHFLEITPHIKYLHGTSIGDPAQIARALRKALSRTGTPFNHGAAQSGGLGLNARQIAQIVGGSGRVTDSVLSVSVERVETIRELGVTLQPAMQVESMLNFQSIGGGKAAVAGEIIVLAQEADVVARSLRSSGLFVTALHNHELFIEPHFYYVHTFGTGSPVVMARAIHDALEHTHSKFREVTSSDRANG